MQIRRLLSLFIFLRALPALSQTISYTDSIKHFINQYTSTHEVIKGAEIKLLEFYPVDEAYSLQAGFEKVSNAPWFELATSGKLKKVFRVYGIARFTIHDTVVSLNIYQSQNLMQTPEYSDYLFLPFTDLTTGTESYEGGRYIDLRFPDIRGNKINIDFNKAYNPLCAYVSGKYNCPVPPRENSLPVRIAAGEKKFGKAHAL